jgi:hypothetical protein
MSKHFCSGRRDFIKMSAAGAAGIVLTSGFTQRASAASARAAAGTAPLNTLRGRVVINFNKSATTSGVAPTAAQRTTIKTMVDDSIKLLTGQTDVGAAWKSIFPSSGPNAISLTSKIAIKVPVGINSSLTAPHWATVQAITEGLQKMDFGSGSGPKFPAANITVYDGAGGNNLSACGFNSTNFPGLGGFVFGSFGTNYTDGAEDNATPTPAKRQYATALHDAAFLINVFSPRGHQPYAENLTLGFKNHYGTYPCVYHDNPNLSQFIRNISCTGPVYNKNVLSMCSGLYGQNEASGPTGSPEDFSVYAKKIDSSSTNTDPTTIIMGTDPVSVEMQAVKMLRMNQTNGQFTVAAMPNYLKASGGVLVTGTNWPPNPAAPSAMDNIGEIDENLMTVRRIINGTVAVRDRPPEQVKSAGAYVTATQIKGHNSTFIEFALPEGHAGETASIEIFDLRGTRLARLSRRVGGVLNHLSWDETDGSGRHAGRGAYIVRLTCGAANVSSQFTLA